MHAMEKPHKMMMAIRLETQLSRICTRRHRRAVWVGGVESSHHVCMRVVRHLGVMTTISAHGYSLINQ